MLLSEMAAELYRFTIYDRCLYDTFVFHDALDHFVVFDFTYKQHCDVGFSMGKAWTGVCRNIHDCG